MSYVFKLPSFFKEGLGVVQLPLVANASALTGGAGRGYKMEGFSSGCWRGVESEGSGWAEECGSYNAVDVSIVLTGGVFMFFF